MQTKEIVVARYKEDISWVNELNLDNTEVLIYEKFDVIDEINDKAKIARMMLPNIGNEAHTYLQHIYDFYYILADVTFFVQGRYDDHSPDFLKFLSGEKPLNESGYTTLCSWDTATSDANGSPHHIGLPVGKYYKEIFGKELNEVLVFGAGAQFAVTREAVHRHPREFYGRLLRLSENTSVFPFVAERLWHKIFQ